MKIREHRGYAHGLQPGTNSDMNCISCRREDKAWGGNVTEYGQALYELAAESREGFGDNPDGYGAYLISRWYYDLIRDTKE